MQALTEKDYKKILICLAIYITSLIVSNTMGLKLMPFIFGTNLSVSVFCFPLVFIMTDLIGEVYGKKMARNFVLAGFVSVALLLLYTFLSTVTPWSTKSLWLKDSYNQVFGLTARISIASLVAFLIGEYQDVFSFFFFKKKLGSKMFWLRSNLSNIWSQFLDTVIFMVIAFYGVYSTPVLISIIIPWWLFKVAMGFAYTPLSYLGIYLLKDKNEAQSTAKN